VTGIQGRRCKHLLEKLKRIRSYNATKEYYTALCGELALEEAMDPS
jgi:hypothetical protein